MDFDAAGSRPKTYLDAVIGSRRESRASTPSTFHPNWVMLDPYLHHHQLPDKDDVVDFTYVSTSSGSKIGVGVGWEIANPTKASFLFYQWIPDEGVRGGSSHESELNVWDAKAVAAHHQSILLRFALPTNKGTFPDFNSEEFFVYQPPPRRILIKIPTCRLGHNIMNCDTNKNTGILCRGNGEFVVAHLSVIPRDRDRHVTAELCCFFGHKGSWCASKSLPICHEKADEKLLDWWETDTVVSFGDFICWVDYLRGILLCDVFSPSPKVKYVPLPIKPYRGRCHPYLRARGNLFAHRNVCVTSGGSDVKFVDVTPSHSWLLVGEREGLEEYEDSEDEDYSIPPSTINSWTLVGGSWVKHDVMTPEEISNITSHKLVLECPLVDPIHPDTIYFTDGSFGYSRAFEEHPSHLIAVNMKTWAITRKFGSYSNRSWNLRFCEPFLPFVTQKLE